MATRVLAGDFPTATRIVATSIQASLVVPDGTFLGASVPLNRSTVESVQLASEQNVKRFGGAAGAAAVGGVLLGPLGVVGGALLGGNKKEATIIIEMKDGRRLLATVDSKTWTLLQAAVF
jgi:hypothetical protein